MQDLISRREFLKSTAKYSLVAATSIYVPSLQAGFWSAFNLHPGRIVAGFLFDQFLPVVVKWVWDGVSNLFSGSHYSYSSSSYSSLMSEQELNHAAYKAAIVVLGVADYEVHRQRQLKLLLNNAIDTNRFLLIRDYLRDEKISLKTADQEISYKVGLDLEPDDLLTIDYFVMGKNQAQHYQNLEEITKVNVFKQWSTGGRL